MYTIIQYIILVPLVSPHPYILHIVPSGMLHPATGSWIVWTLSAGRAGLKNIFTKYDQHHKYRKIYQYITEIIFPGTHLESLRRAKLEPSGPHITWAIVTSCLLDQSGAPSRMSETPSHTRYSLRFGTLNRHKKKLIQLEILHSYHSLGPLTFYHPTPKTKKGRQHYHEEKHSLSVSTHSSRISEPPHQCIDLRTAQNTNIILRSNLWHPTAYMTWNCATLGRKSVGKSL